MTSGPRLIRFVCTAIAANVNHLLLFRASIPVIENLANLGALPDRGAELVVLPLKLEGTEASPVRAIARVEG